MASYMNEAAEALRKAAKEAGGLLGNPGKRAEIHLAVAEGFTRLEAIERGLLPQDMVPVQAGAEQDR